MGCAANCTAESVTFEGDPDIIIVAFYTTAWFTFLLATFSYFKEGCISSHLCTKTDRSLITLVNSWKRSWAPNLPVTSVSNWKRLLLMLGDVQLVSAASIYLIGFTQHCSITQYHFHAVLLLGQAALDTYGLVALVVESEIVASHFSRAWRTPWLVMLLVANIVSSVIVWAQHFLWPERWGLSLQCALEHDFDYEGQYIFLLIFDVGSSIYSMAFILSLFHPNRVFDSLFWVVRQLLMDLPIKLHQCISRLDGRRQTWPAPVRAIGAVLFRPMLGVSTLVVVNLPWIWEVIESMHFQVILCYVSLCIDTRLVATLRSNAKANGLEDSENTWGFGQILPLLLLALPLFQTIETLLATEAAGSPKIGKPAAEEAKTSTGDSASTADIPLSPIPEARQIATGIPDDSQSADAQVSSAVSEPRPGEDDNHRAGNDQPVQRVDTEMNRRMPGINSLKERRRSYKELLEVFRDLSAREIESRVHRDFRSCIILPILVGYASTAVVFHILLPFFHV